ncbi:MAG: hypothetical protein ACJ74H_05520 [Thermoanaerobaculia bacterium]
MTQPRPLRNVQARMPPYCTSCFRDLPSEDALCHCRSSSRSSIVLGLLVFAVVMAGVLTLNVRLCLTGAAIGIVALIIHFR